MFNGISQPSIIADVFDMDLIELLSVSDKGLVYVVGDNNTNAGAHTNYYGVSQEVMVEIEKLKLEVSHKSELLAQKQREIDVLQKLVDTL